MKTVFHFNSVLPLRLTKPLETMETEVVCKSEDNSLHDDSGTDALYIALDESNDSVFNKNSRSDDSMTLKLVPEANTSKPSKELSNSPVPSPNVPVITDYPRPVIPSYPLPPPSSSFFPFHPMFLPAMMPFQHPRPHPSLYHPQSTTDQHPQLENTVEKNTTGTYLIFYLRRDETTQNNNDKKCHLGLFL